MRKGPASEPAQGSLSIGTSLPVALRSPELLHQIPLVEWDAFLASFPVLASIPVGGLKTHDALREALVANEATLPPQLIEALETVHEFQHDEGRDAILDVAQAKAVDLSDLANQGGAALFALKVWQRGRSDRRVDDVLALARLRSQRLDAKRTPHERAGKHIKAPRDLSIEDVQTHVAAWCRKNRRGEDVKVVWARGPESLDFEVMHGHLLRTEVELKGGRPRAFDFRPMHADHVRYERDTGRLTVDARSATMVAAYCAIFGQLLFGDPHFFASERICTLRRMQREGRRCLEHHGLASILRVDVTGMLWLPAEGDKIWIRSNDCFRTVETQSLRFTEGRLVEARLEFTIAGDNRRCIVNVKSPNVIDVKRPRYRDLVLRFLKAVGIRGNFEENGREVDLWDVARLRASEADWRSLFRAEFDDLLQRQLLQPIVLSEVTHPDHPDHPLALRVERDDSGRLFGVSMNEAVPSRELTVTDVSGFTFNVQALVEAVRDALGFTGFCEEIADRVWRVGTREMSTDLTLSLFLVSGEPTDDALVSALSKVSASPKEVRVVLVPTGRNVDLGGRASPLGHRLPLGPFDGLLAKLVDALGIRERVDLRLLVPGDTDLVVAEDDGTATLHGVALDRLGADTHPFKLLLALARTPDRAVPYEELGQVLDAADPKDPKTVHQAKSDLVRVVRAIFADAGKPEPTFIKLIKRGYKLSVTAAVV